MANAVLLQGFFAGQLPGDKAGGCCPAYPGPQEDDGVGSLGSGVLCHFPVSIFLIPSRIPFADVEAFSTSAEAQGGWRQHPVLPCSSPAAELSKKLSKHTSDD